jgi:hypothetical protein
MPFRSKAQQAYMHAAAERGDIKPSIVKEFDMATPKGAYSKLPEHVERMAHGGLACMHCGGSVDRHGYSDGGEVEEEREGGSTYEEQMRRREEARQQEGKRDAGADMAELAGARPKNTGYKVRAYAHGGEADDEDEEDEEEKEKEKRKKALFIMAIRRRK